VIQTTDLDLDGFQALYFNVIGHQWDTYIKRSEFTIKFQEPVPFDGDHWFVYSGKEGVSKHWQKEDLANRACSYNATDYSITCFTNEVLAPRSGITVKFNFDKSAPYFVFPDYGYLQVVSIAFSLAFLVVAYLIYRRFGRNEGLVIPIEFTAPRGVDAAGVGYIIDRKVDTRDVVALILEWAKDGYLIIDDSDKLVKFIWLKSLDEKAPPYQLRLFRELFGVRGEVTERMLQGTFYKSITEAKMGILKYFSSGRNRLFTASGKYMRFLLNIMLWLPFAVAVYCASMALRSQANGANIFILFLLVLSGAFLNLMLSNWKIMSAVGKFFMMLLAVVGGLLIGLGAYYSTAALWPKGFICLATAGLTTIISIFFVGKMHKMSEFGLRVYGQTLGLYNFIKKAEEERMKLLVQENPRIFYDVLPYAYAFNMVKVWADAFKNITMQQPEFYRTGGNYYPDVMVTRLNNSMVHMQSQVFTPPPSSGGHGGGSFGGGSFGGGGFSGGGGGGGGFSGGGFGGGGGGRW